MPRSARFMTNTRSLRRHSQAAEIDADGNLWFCFRPSASPRFSLFPPSANINRRKERVHALELIQNAQDVAGQIPSLCSNTHTRPDQTNPGTSWVLGNRQDLIQAAELWTFISIGVLCSPRAAPVLMCAASWTAVAQARQLQIQSEAGQWAHSWKRK